MTNTIALENTPIFSCSVYKNKSVNFLSSVREVANEFLHQNTNDLDDIYPVKMTGNMHQDPRLADFCHFIADSSRAILDAQGYAIDLFNMYFTGMWTQEHHKNSGMEQHIHGNRDQIVGFYFLDVPEESSRVLFHDPNVGKTITGLPEKDRFNLTQASEIANFLPEEGSFIFCNAWLPHSFTRNRSDKPLKFVHFNLSVEPIPQQQCSVEIV